MPNKEIRIGIYCASSQTGRAYLADFLNEGYSVYGYVRNSAHAESFLKAVREQGGLYLERPANKNKETSRLIPVCEEQLGHDLKKLVWESDLIIIAEPSHYLQETILALKKEGLAEADVPVILSPPRTFAVPYLWNILGTRHPFICFATNPYSCKAPAAGTAYIKRRKRCWVTSLEGCFKKSSIELLSKVFPQAIISYVPAVTSIGNIGAVFHPTPYVLKYEDIKKAQEEGVLYSYYMQAIGDSKEVSSLLEEIDQIRLKIADKLGMETYGLRGKEREQEWAFLLGELRKIENSTDDINKLRKARSETLSLLSGAIVSAQHWLDYTYGVERVIGESLGDTIKRTPTYQKMSVPQWRYVEEDIPSSFLPIMMIAKRLEIDIAPMEYVMEQYHRKFPDSPKYFWRDLEEFSDEFIVEYLKGKIGRAHV